MKKSRMFSLCIGSVLLSQNYWCLLTSTLYRPDTSLRQIFGVRPDGVRLTESSLSFSYIILKAVDRNFRDCLICIEFNVLLKL